MDTIKIVGNPLYQWELGRKVQIFPLPNMTVDEVHFSNHGDPEALVVKPKEENGMIIADIPNILLQSGNPLIVYSVNVAEGFTDNLRSCTFPVRKRAKPSDYVYTETEVLDYRTLEKRMDEWERTGGLTDEQVKQAISNYFEENPDAGTAFEPDNHTILLKDGILSVNTTDQMEQDNTLPITSAGVFATVGNIEALLKTI